MCGIAGIVDRSSPEARSQAIRVMTEALHHRGPNSSGFWSGDAENLSLGHRRLAILDLTAAGHQPMLSASGRFVITFNGEIFNYKQLAHELRNRGHVFRGDSDTEVMLAAFEEWGVTLAIERFNGMFAFAVCDLRERMLHLVRDRIGEKPLYYGWDSRCFLFASELKAFTALPRFSRTINPGGAALALRYSYIPAPWSIYKNIFKLIPGTILSLPLNTALEVPDLFSPDAAQHNDRVCPRHYWRPVSLHDIESDPGFRGSENDAISSLDSLLTDAVKIRMISDVSIGAFLSGGIDSSLIVSLMQKQSHKPVQTFSIGFEDQSFDEAPYAKKVANYLGTVHTELYISCKEIFDVIHTLPKLYDEPFGDSSQIPTYLVSRMCSSQVTVGLSGDGGDELFGGYERYVWANRYWERFGRYPYYLRRLSSNLLRAQAIENIYKLVEPGLPRALRLARFEQRLATLSRLLQFKDRRSLYHGLMSHWSTRSLVALKTAQLPTVFNTYTTSSNQSFLDEMMRIDILSYLPDDIMAKVDRASMAVSLETRAPFLDHRVVEFALGIPVSWKLRDSSGKLLLKRVLGRYIPDSFFERPKMGFSIPLGSWLRSELRPWAEELLSERLLAQSGILRPAPIITKWRQHLSGTHNWEHHLWDILMFQAWLLSNHRAPTQSRALDNSLVSEPSSLSTSP